VLDNIWLLAMAVYDLKARTDQSDFYETLRSSALNVALSSNLQWLWYVVATAVYIYKVLRSLDWCLLYQGHPLIS